MRFIISVIDTTTGTATDDEMAAVDAFNERLVVGGEGPRRVVSRPTALSDQASGWKLSDTEFMQ